MFNFRRSRSNSPISRSPKFSKKENLDSKISFKVRDNRVELDKKKFDGDHEEQSDEDANNMNDLNEVQASWTRCAPADLHYRRDEQ